MSRGQHRQANKHGKFTTRGERFVAKILRGIPNAVVVGRLPRVRLARPSKGAQP